MSGQIIKVIAVVGPTASGKTSLAVSLAQKYHGEVVSADSMQVYRGMDIATAKPTPEEMGPIPHHLIDFLDPSEEFSVADYAKLAHKTIEEISMRGKQPFLVGGTGLYLDSVLDNIQFAQMKNDPQLERELLQLAQQEGHEALFAKLAEVDPETASRLHPNNLGRVIRAIVVYQLTGITMAEHQRRSREGPVKYQSLKIGLNYSDRQILYQRIEQRVDQMLDLGLLDEARQVFDNKTKKTAAQAIGYKELYNYFEGKISLEEAIDQLKRETRRYAKRQLSWLRRDKNILWFYPDSEDFNEILKKIAFSIDNFLKMWYD